MLPTVVLFSDFNLLALNIGEALLGKQCRVIILTEDLARWKEATRLLSENENLKIYSSQKGFSGDYDYFLLVAGFSDLSLFANKDLVLKGISFYNSRAAKGLLALPFYKKPEFTKIAGDSEIRKIFLGDIYGPRMEGAMPSTDPGRIIIFAPDAAAEVIRALFSYSGEKEIVVRAPKSPTPNSIEITLDWLKENKSVLSERLSEKPLPKSETKPPEREVLKKKERRKLLLPAFLLAVMALVSPFIFLFASALALKFSFDSFLGGDTKTAETLIGAADFFSGAGILVAGPPAAIPVVGVPYVFARDSSTLVKEAAIIGKRSSLVLNEGKELFVNIMSESDYDLAEAARQLSVNLELIYQDSSFLESEMGKTPGLKEKISALGVNVDSLRQAVLGGESLAKRLPVILGVDKPKTYLVLFQNSMELRPTGGFIGSFALVTFDRGKLINVEFFDVYTADGQLKGHIEPPPPIKNYLGEANWYLRDSNWDPDFGVSAQRAEWFLDKELDRSVDGVVGVDLEVAKSLLKVLGPVRLTDFNYDIDYKNMYEKVQYQVESNFFPGSQQKKNILTALGRGILDKLKAGAEINFQKIGQLTYENLRGRHIQLFLHDAEVQKSISALGFSGEVSEPQCLVQNCQNVLVGLVEANVGVDKVNYFIARSLNLSSFVSTSGIENTLAVQLVNNAPSALGISGRYKNYVRLITNGTAKIKQVGIIEAGGTRVQTPEVEKIAGRLEAGTLVEIGPGQKKTVRFTWSLPANLGFAANGEINYLIRKQAGTGDDPITIKVNPPQGVDFLGRTGYNTTLSRDIMTKVSW